MKKAYALSITAMHSSDEDVASGRTVRVLDY